jgi:RNA polymerase sigma factor (sigma-70 family)
VALLTITGDTYEAHRDYVLGVLGRRSPWLDGPDREAALHDAYAVLLEKQRDGGLDLEAMHPRQLRAYLVQTALHKALDEGKRAGRHRSVPLGEDDVFADDRGPTAEERVDADTERARLLEILAELPERQQTIVKLRFFFDRSPREIQRYLGVTERVYRRELERAMKAISERFELVRRGEFCESRRSLIVAYVAGVAGESRDVEARRHLSSCPSCARWAAELRLAGAKVAAVAPLPALVASGDARLHGMGERVLGVLETVKQHATGVALRADPGAAGYAAGIRPGGILATVAGCVALTGSAAYCALEGLPVVPHPRGEHAQQADARPRAKRKDVARTSVAPMPTSRPPRPQPTATPAPRKQERSERKRDESKTRGASGQVSAPAAVDAEFGVEAAVEPVAPAPSAAAPAPPPHPPGEFDP